MPHRSPASRFLSLRLPERPCSAWPGNAIADELLLGHPGPRPSTTTTVPWFAEGRLPPLTAGISVL